MAIIKVTDSYGLPCVGWEVVCKDADSPSGLTQYSSKDHSWAEVPDGVLIAIWWHEYHMEGLRKKTLSGGKDYYVFIDQKKWGDTDDFEEVKDLDFKRGVWTDDDQFERIYRKSFEKKDMD